MSRMDELIKDRARGSGEAICIPELREQSHPKSRDCQSRAPSHDDGRGQTEPCSRHAGLELAELIGSSNEHEVDRAHAAANVVGCLELHEDMADIDAHHV